MNKSIKPTLNAEQVIINPEFHDANLNKIELLPGKKAKILLKTVTNLVFEFVFNDIEYLNCVNFKEGNIVFDVVAWSSKQFPEDDLRELLGISSGKHNEYLRKISKDIENGKLTLIMVNPSYGCELVCLCESYDIFELS